MEVTVIHRQLLEKSVKVPQPCAPLDGLMEPHTMVLDPPAFLQLVQCSSCTNKFDHHRNELHNNGVEKNVAL